MNSIHAKILVFASTYQNACTRHPDLPKATSPNIWHQHNKLLHNHKTNSTSETFTTSSNIGQSTGDILAFVAAAPTSPLAQVAD